MRIYLMKDFKKYFVLAAIAALIPACANADITVKDTTSPEFIQNQGYSAEVSRIIDVKTKDLSTPLSTEQPSVWKRFGYYVRETINPAYDKPGKYVNHDTRFNPSIEDL